MPRVTTAERRFAVSVLNEALRDRQALNRLIESGAISSPSNGGNMVHYKVIDPANEVFKALARDYGLGIPSKSEARFLVAGTGLRKSMDDFWISMGWFRKVDGKRVATYADWSDNATCIAAIKFLVEKVLRIDPLSVTTVDFSENRLGGMLATRYGSRPHLAVLDAYPEKIEAVWMMHNTSPNLFDDEAVRKRATKWLVGRTGKKPNDLTCRDFIKNGLKALIKRYNSSVLKAIREAYPENDYQPMDMVYKPKGYFSTREVRTEATRNLVEKVLDGKVPLVRIKKDHFLANGLGNMLKAYYSSSPYLAIIDAYPKSNIRPFQMEYTPKKYYGEKPLRIEAVKWLVEVVLKNEVPLTELTSRHFSENGFDRLLHSYYDDLPYLAVREAYPERQIKPSDMRYRPDPKRLFAALVGQQA